MSSLRLLAVPVCALLLATACGRTESLYLASGPDTGGDTWSYEDTAAPPDTPGWDTIADESTDDWMTGDWGEEAPDTWGEEDPDVDWGESEEFDWGEEDPDVDWGEEDPDVDTETTESTTDTETTESTTDTETTDTTTTDTETTESTTTESTDTETGGDTCADAAQCLIDCGGFSGQCISDCTDTLPQDESSALFDLQICAIQSCFFLGECQLADFNSADCVQCRLDVNADPQGFGCGPQGMVCGI